GGVCLAVGGAGAVPARARTTTDTELAGYFALAAASGFQVTQDQPAALVHPQVEFEAGDAVSTLSTGPRGYAFSTVAWPGPLVGNLGTTLIVGGGAAPSVSLLDDPVRAEARTGSGQPKVENDSVPGATMTAQANGGDVSATTTLAGAAVPAMLVVGKITTDSATKLGATTVTGTAS